MSTEITVAALYKFARLDDVAAMQQAIGQVCESDGLMGTILLADEGINGTIAGSAEGVSHFLNYLQQLPVFAGLSAKKSYCQNNPFHRMKVRLKKEIVTMGVDDIDPNSEVGQYVAPEQWNELITRTDVRLVDTRNDYEFGLGTFVGAEDPDITSFRDFPAWVDQHLDADKDEHVAMFCTGGIRCEKSTALLKQKGFKNVYHLEGGILNYLEKISPDDSQWQGECFVFDNRVTVDHALQEGFYDLCPACRMPISDEDRQSRHFEENVSCPKCIDRLTPARREGLEERARQIKLSAARGEKHIGSR